MDAFQTLSERYASALQRHIRHIIRDSDSSEDLLQETMLKVWLNATQYDGTGEVKAWLFKIATNLSLNHLRSQKRRREVQWDQSMDELDAPASYSDHPISSPEDYTEAMENARRMRSAIEDLPEDKRDVMRLVHEQHLNTRLAANQLGIPEGTVKSRLHHARRILARLLSEQEEK